MKNLRKQDGFTLVEMMVTLLIGTIIMGAAVTVLLLGLRVNFKSSETVSRQNTTRILLSALESMATEGSIKKVETAPDYWKVWTEGETSAETDDVVSFSYKLSEATVYTGNFTIEGEVVSGTPLLEGVYSSFVTLENKQLTVTVETEEGEYSSTVYCRMAGTSNRAEVENDQTTGNLKDNNNANDKDIIDDSYTSIDGTEEDARLAFLRILASQYSGTGPTANRGWIIGDSSSGVKYYVKWYNDQWPEKTPWCACFISWGIEQVKGHLAGEAPCYANVDTFMADFQNKTAGSWRTSKYYLTNNDTEYTPVPGDIVFFDWIVNGQDNPQHAGVVLQIVEENGKKYIYTIEGNTDGMVAIRKYPLNDPCILGYGVLDWK